MRTSKLWRASLSGGFSTPRGRSGQELAIQKHFEWNGHRMTIPSIYLCGKGLVVDLLTCVPRSEIQSFLDKWKLSPEQDGSGFSEEQYTLCQAENPLSPDLSLQVRVNGKALSFLGGCGVCWDPIYPSDADRDISAVMTHYDLDRADGWAVQRFRFSWATVRRPKIRTLDITLCAQDIPLAGPHFTLAPGETFLFTHPVTGVRHSLKVCTLETEVFPEFAPPHSPFGRVKHPAHVQTMTYTLTPDLPDSSFRLRDTLPPDRVRFEAGGPDASSFGIIGGEDGPTAIYIGGSRSGSVHTAFSSPSFEPRGPVEWQLTFRKKPCADLTLRLLG